MYRAIIIDDEYLVIKSLIATIEGQELFEITGEFYDGISAFSYIREHNPDLAFIDIKIPGMNGLELLQSAKQMNLSTLFIVISGHAEFAYAQKAMFNNALSYCLKPFSKSELMDSMQKAWQLLENRESRTSAEAPDGFQEEELPFGIPKDFCPPERLKTSNRMTRVMLDYIAVHYNEYISIQKLADFVHITPNYASRLFKEEVGFTFCSYLTVLRIYLASKLLLRMDMPIFMVANQVGYKDYFYFAKVFKRFTGYSPSSYRSTFRKEESSGEDTGL